MQIVGIRGHNINDEKYSNRKDIMNGDVGTITQINYKNEQHSLYDINLEYDDFNIKIKDRKVKCRDNIDSINDFIEYDIYDDDDEDDDEMSDHLKDILIDKMVLAYCITIHKSQGSEYDNIIIPIIKDQYNMTRQMLYTAITRAKKKVILIGDKKVLSAIIANNNKFRKTKLSQRIINAQSHT